MNDDPFSFRLDERIEDWFHTLDRVDCSSRGISQFLEGTSHVDLSPAERLRQLGILIEGNPTSVCGWKDLFSVYKTSLSLETMNSVILTSTLISGVNWLKFEYEEFSDEVAQLLQVCGDLVDQLGSIEGHSAQAKEFSGDLHYFGEWCLNDQRGGLSRALTCYQSSVELHETEVRKLKVLYCHSDLEEWDQCLKQIRKISLAKLESEWNRNAANTVREMEVLACFGAGNEARGKFLLIGFLDQFERDSQLGLGSEYDSQISLGRLLRKFHIASDLRARLEGTLSPSSG